MAVSTQKYIRELIRQSLMEDTHFLKRLLYYFELQVPSEVSTLGGYFGFVFPLIIPPTAYSMEEPFTVEATPTQGGGLYVEENGIVQRMIRLSGHTGFKPRPLKMRLGDTYAATLAPDKKSHSRTLPTLALDKISGQRHFQYLQDSVFRTYADLKRDPSTSKDTKMLFHNPRDQEHWVVVPQRFALERDASSPLLYRYNIELLVVGPGEDARADFSEDRGILDSIKDFLRMIKRANDLVTGAINDLTAMVNDIKLLVNDIGTIIDSVNAITSAATDFVNGVTDLIEAPLDLIDSVMGSMDAALEHLNALEELGQTVYDFPSNVKNKFRACLDGLATIGAFPALFVTSSEVSMATIRKEQTPSRKFGTARLEEALASDAPANFDEARALGTKLTPGDAQSAKGENTTGSAVKKYRSVRQVEVEQGDTLMGLAAKYLGDARAWQYIATANGLKPPFIDKQASVPLVSGVGIGSTISGAATGADILPFPNVLGIGSKILIPSNKRSALDLPVLPVWGANPDEPAEDQFMGTDFALEVVSGLENSSHARYDFAIDTDLGSIDAKTVSGHDNLKQALITRLVTERGTDTLYKALGMKRVVGLGFAPLDLEIAKFYAQEAVSDDARIAAVRNVLLQQNGDALEIDMRAEIRGFAESRPVRATI